MGEQTPLTFSETWFSSVHYFIFIRNRFLFLDSYSSLILVSFFFTTLSFDLVDTVSLKSRSVVFCSKVLSLLLPQSTNYDHLKCPLQGNHLLRLLFSFRITKRFFLWVPFTSQFSLFVFDFLMLLPLPKKRNLSQISF